MLDYEVCHSDNLSCVHAAWPVLKEVMERSLRSIDPALAYHAACKRAAEETHNPKLADAWERAERRACRIAFRGWRRFPESLTITAR